MPTPLTKPGAIAPSDHLDSFARMIADLAKDERGEIPLPDNKPPSDRSAA